MKQRSWKFRLHLARIFPPKTFIPVIQAVVVGVCVGGAAVVYQGLLGSVSAFVFGPLQQSLSFLGSYSIVIIPALGGLIAGPLLHYFARDAKGHGVPEVMSAVVLRGGRISPAILVNAVASVFTIGFGGSAGRVAPIVQIGSALGSGLGQVLDLSPERLRNLVACGAAAGIAAAFNAPIAGVFFALEVILGEIGAGSISLIVIAAVSSSVVGRSFLGDVPAFVIPEYTFVSSWELLLYAGLGGCAAFVGVFFVHALEFVSTLFKRWNLLNLFEPAVGALLLGCLALVFPEVLGMGAPVIERALYSAIPWHWLLALCFAKIVATSLTLGSGGAGGIFAPTLFIGAMLGGAYGFLMHHWLPDITASPAAYALVGMAALFAATARAPITAVLILFEMTRDYRVMLALMLATVVSVVVASLLEPESIYTKKLVNAGIDLQVFREYNLMRAITVEEAMTSLEQLPPIRRDVSLKRLAALFAQLSYRGFAVLDEDSKLFGMVTFSDMQFAQSAPGWEARTVADICATDLCVAFPDESLEDALAHFAARDVGRIPVVTRKDPRLLLGVLRREGIIRAYARAVRDVEERRQRMQVLQMRRETQSYLVTFVLLKGDAAVGHCVMDICWPADSLLVSIRREHRSLIPRGKVRLLAGDNLVLLVAPEHGKVRSISRILKHGAGACEVEDAPCDL